LAFHQDFDFVPKKQIYIGEQITNLVGIGISSNEKLALKTSVSGVWVINLTVKE